MPFENIGPGGGDDADESFDGVSLRLECGRVRHDTERRQIHAVVGEQERTGRTAVLDVRHVAGHGRDEGSPDTGYVGRDLGSRVDADEFDTSHRQAVLRQERLQQRRFERRRREDDSFALEIADPLDARILGVDDPERALPEVARQGNDRQSLGGGDCRRADGAMTEVEFAVADQLDHRDRAVAVLDLDVEVGCLEPAAFDGEMEGHVHGPRRPFQPYAQLVGSACRRHESEESRDQHEAGSQHRSVSPTKEMHGILEMKPLLS